MKRFKFLLVLAVALISATAVFTSCSKDDDGSDSGSGSGSGYYDVIQINGTSYACYGYRMPITYESSWNTSTHSGELLLPCGKLSDAQKGEFDYDDMYSIELSGSKELTKGCNLKDFNPTFTDLGVCYDLPYVSGTATVVDKQDDEYITVKFTSCKFAQGSKSYTLDGTVQLSLDED